MSTGPLDDGSLYDAIAAGKKDVKLSNKIMLSVEEDKRKLLAELAGGHLEEMLENQRTTEAYLSNSDPKLRSSALMLMADHWRNTAKLPELCERIALGDQDLEVSGLALTILYECFEGTKDRRIGRLLASLVCDESRPFDFRACAYNGLFQISGMPVSRWPNMKRFLGSCHFPDDVDWTFVQSFFSQS